MAGYTSPKQQEAKDDLIIGLRTFVANKRGGITEAAHKAKMDPQELSKILRLERAISLPRLFHLGEALGLKLTMRWEE